MLRLVVFIALDVGRNWLFIFGDIFAIVFVVLSVQGDCTLFSLGHFCSGLYALDVLELIAVQPCEIGR